MCLPWQPPDGSAVRTFIGNMEELESNIMVYHLDIEQPKYLGTQSIESRAGKEMVCVWRCYIGTNSLDPPGVWGRNWRRIGSMQAGGYL
jgi:hypothetical protein